MVKWNFSHVGNSPNNTQIGSSSLGVLQSDFLKIFFGWMISQHVLDTISNLRLTSIRVWNFPCYSYGWATTMDKKNRPIWWKKLYFSRHTEATLLSTQKSGWILSLAVLPNVDYQRAIFPASFLHRVPPSHDDGHKKIRMRLSCIHLKIGLIDIWQNENFFLTN